MNLKPLEEYYELQPEPTKGCMLAVRKLILERYPQLQESWKYRMPFFCLENKMFCYLWTEKHTKKPYLGIVEGRKLDHPLLIQGNRSRMKILMIDPTQDLPINTICSILDLTLKLYTCR